MGLSAFLEGYPHFEGLSAFGRVFRMLEGYPHVGGLSAFLRGYLNFKGLSEFLEGYPHFWWTVIGQNLSCKIVLEEMF